MQHEKPACCECGKPAYCTYQRVDSDERDAFCAECEGSLVHSLSGQTVAEKTATPPRRPHMLFEVTRSDTYDRTWIVRADSEDAALSAVKRHFTKCEPIAGLIAAPTPGMVGDHVDSQYDVCDCTPADEQQEAAHAE